MSGLQAWEMFWVFIAFSALGFIWGENIRQRRRRKRSNLVKQAESLADIDNDTARRMAARKVAERYMDIRRKK